MKKRTPLIMLFCLLVVSTLFFAPLPQAASALQATPPKQDDFDTDVFARLPVLQEGRLKPMDSLARIALYTLSGRDSVHDLHARDWLMEVFFDPAQAITRPVFFVTYPEQLGLERVRGRLYSYQSLSAAMEQHKDALAKAMEQDPKTWTKEQQNLIQAHEKILIFEQLSHSFSFLLPLRIPIPDDLGKKLDLPSDRPLTLLDLQRHGDVIDRRAEKVIKQKGSDEKNFTPDEKAYVDLAVSLTLFSMKGAENKILRIIPPLNPDLDASWVSPWSILTDGQGSPQTGALTRAWQGAAMAYLRGDAPAWDGAMITLRDLYAPYVDATRLSFEIIYNHLHPYTVAMLFYGFGFLCFCLWAAVQKPMLRQLGLGALAAGIAIHITAIGFRMYLLERPPVGTLYESLLFVALMVAIIGLVWDLKTRASYGLFTASLGGVMLLFAAQGLTDHDTLKMLVAVLNTNFWLATHVLCITIGYAWCVIAALTAHIMLFKTMRGDGVQPLMPALEIFTVTSLLFVSVGTILGGIWADQSWGRFWGWDPKENGALLIVLWIAWLLHGRMAGMINKNSYLAGIAALNILVALTWFGVNLLNVGLHSYGFITGIGVALGGYCAVQTALILFLWVGARRQERALA